MTNRFRAVAGAAAAIWLFLGAGSPARAQARMPVPEETHEEAVVTMVASGPFEVKLTPQATDEGAEGTPLGRMSIDKQFHGDLEGTSRGEMLSAMTPVQGSAGYVAIERVRGTLGGRTGTFVLQHTGVMDRGAQQLTITVVPDSGTGELTGLTGRMSIDVAGGKHAYRFEYTLPDAH